MHIPISPCDVITFCPTVSRSRVGKDDMEAEHKREEGGGVGWGLLKV